MQIKKGKGGENNCEYLLKINEDDQDYEIGFFKPLLFYSMINIYSEDSNLFNNN